MIAKGAGRMILIKLAEGLKPRLARLGSQDLKAMAAKLLEAARKLPAGPVRYDIPKQIGKFA